ncbi:arylsulfatase [Roseomonas sp. M0104]|uniref:Arylsulfatase n=1 Tax=Teichococcus coralli TaxID=2545983 RepID=A0A845BBQ0_9PROT|nr:arylsulfatase [Pseudoroseomonas coralli]MXP63570.1 arylsulfatase [Pseudoroseomonas coralli]
MADQPNRRTMLLGSAAALAAPALTGMGGARAQQAQRPAEGGAAPAAGTTPNILVIWGDDIGVSNVSAYNHGIMGYRTPNIDRIGREGAIFTDAYGQQSCTAGRASFILGQHPFRTGLLTIGMPGDPHGIPEWSPTIATLLKERGYATAQFGKNHLGDRDKHLPTNNGFDEFFGNLYHLNAEEEPETYYYPKDPAFRQKFGPRGVIRSNADGRIEDTGPLNRKRMETVDEEFLAAGLDFIDRQNQAKKPFFMWFNSTRMHVWTHLKPASQGTTGVGLYPDGMVEHDGHVGQLLNKLDQLGIADNTIVIYSTDNGAEVGSWPDGGITPFHGEKGTTWEGGFRVPQLVRWPGVIAPGTVINDMMSHEDWMPTLLAAAGEPDIVQKLANGHQALGKTWKIHADGQNFLPFFQTLRTPQPVPPPAVRPADAPKGPRDTIYYFGQGGELNAVRWDDWKIHFATLVGNIATGTRSVPAWPVIINLRADPYEKAPSEASNYIRWYADLMWLLVPVQGKIKEFIGTLDQFPMQTGNSLNAAGIGYNTLRATEALQRLQQLESLSPPVGR